MFDIVLTTYKPGCTSNVGDAFIINLQCGKGLIPAVSGDVFIPSLWEW